MVDVTSCILTLFDTSFSYRSDENNFPMQLCKGRRIIRTAIPARHDIPISIQSRMVTMIACSGPAHRKCKNIVTLKEEKQSLLRNV